MSPPAPSFAHMLCHWLNRPFVRPRPPGRESYEAYTQYEYEMAPITLHELRPITFAHKQVLDIGCGSGGKSVFFAEQGVKKLIAIDIEPKRLETARRFAQEKGLSSDTIAFIQADACHLPFADNAFDVVIANDSFEHLFNLADTLAECYRVTAPGGYLGFNLLPYPSRDGAHLYDYIQIPWCQFLLPESWLVSYWKHGFIEDYTAGRFRAFSHTPESLASVTTIRDLVHVNQLWLRDIKAMVCKAGFHPVREERLCSRKLGFLQHLPILNEFVTYGYKAVYQKPH